MTKSGTVFCLFSALGVFASVCGAQTALATRAPLLERDALNQAGYRVLWETSVPARNEPVLGAHLVDENLYITTRAGSAFAIQADTGLLRWNVGLDHTLLQDRAPSHVQDPAGGGPVLFVTHSDIHVFDRYSGDLLRRFELPFPAGGGAVADRVLMCIGSTGGRLHALHWSIDPGRLALQRWEVMVRGVVTSTPVSIFDRWYAVSDGGVVYCIRPADKHLHWAFEIGARVAGGIHVDESGVYVASIGRTLHVIDTDTGESIWAHRFPGPLFEAPDVVQRTCYQFCQGSGLYAFDVDTREQLWTNPRARRYVARAGEDLVLLSESNDLIFADNRRGTARQTIKLPAGAIAVRNTRDAVLYVVGADGRVACAAPKRYPYLRREAVIRARAELSRPPSTNDTAEAGTSVGASPEAPGASRANDPLRSASDG